MNPPVKTAGYATFGALLLWAAFGFMAWNWNAADWPPSGRGALIFFWLTWSAAAWARITVKARRRGCS